MHNKYRVLFIVSVIILAIIALSVRPAGKPPTVITPKVKIISAKTTDIPIVLNYAGRAAGSLEVEVRSQISGIITSRNFTEGKVVKAGTGLFTIDPEQFIVSKNAAVARFQFAEGELKRVGELLKNQAVSQRDYDQVQTSYNLAKSDLDSANIKLSYTKVPAPITGVTGREAISVGSLVSERSTLLTKITQLDPIYINFSYPDSDAIWLSSIKTKLLADISLRDGNVYTNQGTINFKDSLIDAKTSMISARAVMPNPDHKIMPGEFLQLTIKGLIQKSVVLLPDQAIIQTKQGVFVWIVHDNNKVSLQPVKLGPLTADGRVVVSGIKNGDRVVIDGMIKLKPDTRVDIEL